MKAWRRQIEKLRAAAAAARAQADVADRSADEIEAGLNALEASSAKAPKRLASARSVRVARDPHRSVHVDAVDSGKAGPISRAVGAMAAANRTKNGDNLFVVWVASTPWKTASNWAKGHGILRTLPNAWMATGKAHRHPSEEAKRIIEGESGGAVPASFWCRHPA